MTNIDKLKLRLAMIQGKSFRIAAAAIWPNDEGGYHVSRTSGPGENIPRLDTYCLETAIATFENWM